MPNQNLCFAVYAQCLKKVLRESNSDTAVFHLLLDWITDNPSVLNRKKMPVIIEPREISRIMNRKIELPTVIKDFCSTEEIVPDAIEHCRTQVIPKLNPIRRRDLYQMLWLLVENDEEIAPETKKELEQHLHRRDEAEFLGKLLIYVINRSNKRPEEEPGSDDFLLEEVNNECPLCNTKLKERTKNGIVKSYGIVKIFPSDLSDPNTAKIFAGMQKPQKPDAIGNKIALCRRHAKTYRIAPTLSVYTKLKKIKEGAEAAYLSKLDINDIFLEDEIQQIILVIANNPEPTLLTELSFNALRIDQKIPMGPSLLGVDIKMWVGRYYNYINELFAAMDRNGTNVFERIASDIRAAYLELNKRELSQEEIVDALAEWIMVKAKVGSKKLLACHIVVAFFIQNCEVFDEIS